MFEQVNDIKGKQTQRLTGLPAPAKLVDSTGDFAAVKKTGRFETFAEGHQRKEGGYVDVSQPIWAGTSAKEEGASRTVIADYITEKLAGKAEPVVEAEEAQPVEDAA